jgi:signal transduction histidine kinase
MIQNQHKSISIGGAKLINWKLYAPLVPFIILVVPLTQNENGDGWTFWRWTLSAIIGLLPPTILYLIGDVLFFHKRNEQSVKPVLVFAFGLALGASQGFTTTYVAHILNLVNENLYSELIFSTVNSALIGLLILPLSSLVAASYESYRFDRNQLLTDKMATESKKTESQAILRGLRESMSNKVDQNLLEILQTSKDFFDQRERSLDQNWELMAEKLRSAALETVRPFSHNLHRRGTEREYSVRPSEILKYVSHSIVIHIPWVLLIYGVTTYTTIYSHSDFTTGTTYLLLRLAAITVLMLFMRMLKTRNHFRTLPSFFLLLTLCCASFAYLNTILDEYFDLTYQSFWNSVANAAWLGLIIFSVGLVSAFIDGQRAEIDFIQNQLSQAEVSALLIKREEARISRELAKYLHGTIQSRLMASAMEVERAGRSGDKKAVAREIQKAYKTLKLPDEDYFSTPEKNLSDELRKVSAKWDKLLKIKFSTSKDLSQIDENLSQDIGNVINEAIANSFRHGAASKVDVKIKSEGKDIVIEVVDDGSGLGKGKPGLGTDTFSSLVGVSWKLTPLPKNSGTLLFLRVKNVL